MGSLANCLKKHAKQLRPGDAEAIREAASAFEREGMKPSAAAERAVLEILADEQSTLGDLAKQVDAKGGKVPDWVPDAIAERTQAEANDRDSLSATAAAGSRVGGEAPAQPALPSPKPSGNTIFTDEAAEKARALLRARLGRPNAGLDPEMVQAGIQLAGWHIEKGARTFAAYSRAMIDDLGDTVRPYLKQWYAAAYFDPRAGDLQSEMTPPGDLAAAEILDGSDQPANTSPAPPVDPAGAGALDGVPADDGQGADPKRPPRRRPRGSSGSNVAGNGTADGRGDGLAPGLGNDQTELPLFATGNPQGVTPPAPQFVPEPAPLSGDFTIADDLAIGTGGQRTKYQRNVEAIRLLKQLDAEGRNATPDEQRTLALYVGWGGLAGAFDEGNANWSTQYAELAQLLTPDEYDTARQSTQYAHYTSPKVITAMYDAVRKFGFAGGRVLEAGGGVGNFIGLMPQDLRGNGRFTLVEREKIAAGIARHLYPKQLVLNADFQEFGAGEDGVFDMVIGNPPFGATALTDKSGRRHLTGLRIHNYFVAKSLDLLREGGVMAVVVSNGFMDTSDQTTRRYIGERAKFLGAIRLPNDAFKANAGTEVTTDIVFFAKRPESEVGSKAARAEMDAWQIVLPSKGDDGTTLPLNNYFVRNRDMMLGEWGSFGTMYRAESAALRARANQDLAADLRGAIENLPADVYVARSKIGTDPAESALRERLHDTTVDVGGYYSNDGKLWQRVSDVAGEQMADAITPESKWTNKTVVGKARYGALVRAAQLRRTVRELLAAESDNDMPAIRQLREQLNRHYDNYVKEHGPINDRYTKQLLDDDPDYSLLAGLEETFEPSITLAAATKAGTTPRKASATKAAIFSKRLIEPRSSPQTASSPEDALNISIAERGAIDLPYVGSLLNRDPNEALREMLEGEQPLLFVDPVDQSLVLRDAYLSGNVRQKLRAAEAARMGANIEALKAAMPKDRPASQISANLGAPWIPLDTYEAFANELFGSAGARISRSQLTSTFDVRAGSETRDVNMISTYGTNKMPANTLLTILLNKGQVRVMQSEPGGRQSLNVEATEQAKERAQKIIDKWGSWVMADADRAIAVKQAYNEANNNYVPRRFDGSWLRFPGKVPDALIRFRRHQSDFVARVMQTRTALADHVVGAGKTYAAISAAMELKRTGLVRKSMIAVPNHLVKMWARDVYSLYPGAKVLAATKKDFERANRRQFLARVATGDWDIVIIAHSSFGYIKPSSEFEQEFGQKQVDDIVRAIKEAEEKEGGANTGGKQKKSRAVKRLEAMKERIENRIDRLRDKPIDNILEFGQLGVDQLFVDEAHMFKNLMFITQMQNVRELGDPEGSQRAYDMMLKTRELMHRNGGDRGVVFLTGTPVSNSLAEQYHMMRYLMPSELDAQGLQSFDAWANTFADVTETLKPTTAGGYKNVTAFAGFNNLYDMLAMYDMVADTVTMDQIKRAYREEKGKDFPIPPLRGGARAPVVLELSAAQGDYMKQIAVRAAIIEARKGPPLKGEDNQLTLMGDARKAAMDIRLAEPTRLLDPATSSREKGGRIDRAAQEIVARYQESSLFKGTQLVFSDLGTPLSTVKAEVIEYKRMMQDIAKATDLVRLRAESGDEAATAIVEAATAAEAQIEKNGRDWQDAILAAQLGFSVYDDLRKALTERGIPASEVAFIHEYSTDDQKAALFHAVNAGTIRVLVGSTSKMGAGTNVQKRLVALHHLDIPWRPSDVEQREGRIVRQNNLMYDEGRIKDVEILAYVTKDTLDKNMWAIQERKLRGINQLRAREVENTAENAFEDMEMSASEMQAAATGDLRMLKVIELDNAIKKMDRRERAHQSERADDVEAIRTADREIKSYTESAAKQAAFAAVAQQYVAANEERAANLQATIDSETVRGAGEIAKRLTAAIDATTANKDGKEVAAPLSINLNGEVYTARDKLAEAFADLRGDAAPFEMTINGETFNRRGKAVTAVFRLLTDYVHIAATIGPFSVEMDKVTRGRTHVASVTLKGPGGVIQEASNNIETERAETDWQVVASWMVGAASKMAQDTDNGDWKVRLAASAAKRKAQYEAKGDIGPFPDSAALEAMRNEHRALTSAIKADADLRVAAVAGTFQVETPGKPAVTVREDAAVYGPTTTIAVAGQVSTPRRPKSVAGQPAKDQAQVFLPAPAGALTPTAPTLAQRGIARATFGPDSRVHEVQVGTFRSAFDVIDNWAAAAHVLAPLRKLPFERMMVLAVDKENRPVRILTVFNGTIDAAPVYPREILLNLIGTNAAAVYLAHNHPSGVKEPSAADVKITQYISEALRPLGIVVREHMIFTANQARVVRVFSEADALGFLGDIATGGKKVVEIPQFERRYRPIVNSVGPRFKISSPQDAAIAVAKFGQTGMILLSNQHEVIGTLPIPPADLLAFNRDTIKQVVYAVRDINVAAIVVAFGDGQPTQTVSQATRKMREYLQMANVRVLDAFADGGPLVDPSAFVRETNGFFSMPPPARLVAASTGSNVTAIRAAAAAAAKQFGVTINVVANTSDPSMPERVRGTYPGAQGYSDGYAAWVFTDNLSSLAHAQNVIAHEVIGHVGVERLLADDDWAGIVATVRGVLDGTIPATADAGQANRAAALNASELPSAVSAEVAGIIREAAIRYAGATDSVLAKEAVAMMAERGVKASLLDRMLAAMRRALRRVFKRLGWSDAELRDLIARSAENLQRAAATGETVAPTVQADPMMAQGAPDPDQRDPDAILNADRSTEKGARLTLGALNVAASRMALRRGRNGNRSRMGELFEEYRGDWLKLLGRTQIVEVGNSAVPRAVAYGKLADQMDAYMNALMEPAAKVAKRWASLIGSDKATASKLARLMHKSSVEQFDPERQQPTGDNGRPFPGSMIQRQIKADWDALPEVAKQLYRDVRQSYMDRSVATMNALIGRIQLAQMDGRKKAEAISMVRAHFESAKLRGPYFPLSRFGDYWIRATKNGKTEFILRESPQQWRDTMEELTGEGYTIDASGKKIRELAADPGPGAGFMVDVIAILDKAGQDDLAPLIAPEAARVLQDSVWQLYLESLPELSLRKHSLHRQGTPGYSEDALRAFANHMSHGARQIARLEYGHRMARELIKAREEMGESSDPLKAADIIKALDSSYQWQMNPKGSRTATYLTAFGFAFHLGVSAAAVLVNLAQTATVTFPILGARYGFDRAGAALLKASKDYLITVRFAPGHQAARAAIDAEFDGGMGLMLKELEESGRIDRTMTMALTGLGEDRAAISLTMQKIMGPIAYGFHHAERMNREVTAMAAYRLARQAGKDHAAALEYADQVVVRSHFNYNSSNRAALMQGDVAKVLLLFKQYAQNMLFLIWRDVHQATLGESAEVKRLARRELAGLMGMTFATGGLAALPMYGEMMGLLSLLFALSDDDDEPRDAEMEFRQWLAGGFAAMARAAGADDEAQAWGAKMGEAVSKGPINAFVGLDLSSRLSLDDLLWRSSNRDTTNREATLEAMQQVAGPVVGIVFQWAQAADIAARGEYLRALETALPKAIKDVFKGVRYQTDGEVLSARGIPVLSEISMMETIFQTSGFAPARLNAAYERAAAASRLEERLLRRRTEILAAYYAAAQEPDQEAMLIAYATANGMTAGWNEKNPDWPIERSSIVSSVESRMRVRENAVDGATLNPTIARRLREEPY